MVRSQGKQSADEKREGKKKSSKKKPETGSWPCKINGCNKVFAREADLKRHQRTTKTHSIPGFQCPQCDATFTRTDALRRHQKSRHNGVVIEPSEEKEKHSGDGASSGSRSPSPGGTPARSQGEGSMNGSPPATQSSGGGPSSGPSSYYRPHTMQDGGGYYAGYPPPPRPPPPGMVMDLHYQPPPIGLPTSATRSHQGNWQPPPPAPPWGPDGHPMHPPGMYMPSYYPTPYYRHPGMPIPPHPGHFPPQINPDLLSQSEGQMSGVAPPESALRDTSPDKPESSSNSRQEHEDAHAAGLSMQSSVDPRNSDSMRSTQAQPSTHGLAQNGAQEGPDASTLMAAAALQAVLAFQRDQEIRDAASQRAVVAQVTPQAEVQAQSASSPGSPDGAAAADSSNGAVGNAPTAELQQDSSEVNGNSDAPVAVDGHNANHTATPTAEGNAHVLAAATDVQQSDAATSGSIQPMDQLVDEDGMPMLNPAELLTQESLASPPAS
ncbi:hypothetical protein BC628DRAFT_1192832 [Trametes gibbosa]|uniref:C2H2-type domain-containing protein n=1 Tax=Trametes gibbosa TaxID=160864 RepID=A0A6G6FQG6_9APHY|nr:hypothetical protein BC628DRAFT_1192832 [Trametes gibbosa]QIE48510.1 hypothetical protein [Trametes gibbosa]